MAYKPRDERSGYHHVVTRGNNKQRIFLNNHDRAEFLLRLNDVATRHGWEILAYCLMRNHYHLVLRVGDRGLSRGMCELNTGYALQFNKDHRRINHLFGRRYWNAYLAGEGRVLNAIRYVVQNPRRAGASGPLERHAWTSYRGTIGLALSFPRLGRDELLGLFARRPDKAKQLFIAFCEGPGPGGVPPDARSGQPPAARWQPP